MAWKSTPCRVIRLDVGLPIYLSTPIFCGCSYLKRPLSKGLLRRNTHNIQPCHRPEYSGGRGDPLTWCMARSPLGDWPEGTPFAQGIPWEEPRSLTPAVTVGSAKASKIMSLRVPIRKPWASWASRSWRWLIISGNHLNYETHITHPCHYPTVPPDLSLRGLYLAVVTAYFLCSAIPKGWMTREQFQRFVLKLSPFFSSN